MSRKGPRKSGGEITLAEHAARIAPLGGRARAEALNAHERSEIARKGGKAGGRARAQRLHRNSAALSRERRPKPDGDEKKHEISKVLR
jgi:general stress protein YciG